jgi:D-galactarolactone cycloisomerase
MRLQHLVVGEDPLQPEVLWHRMYHYTRDYGQKGAVVGAISGIDIALWDICGKARNTRWRSCSAARSAPGSRPTRPGFYRIKGHGEAPRLAKEFETTAPRFSRPEDQARLRHADDLP